MGGERKKWTVCFPYHEIVLTRGAYYCLLQALASHLVVNAVSSNSKAVLSNVSPCNVVFSGRSKMSGSGSMLTKPIRAPERGRKPQEPSTSDNCKICGFCFKTKFSNFKSGWISAENMFVVPTRKNGTLPKLVDLLKNELFVVVDKGESFYRRVCSPCRTKV